MTDHDVEPAADLEDPEVVPEEAVDRPHGYKLQVLCENEKLVDEERSRVKDEAMPRYETWVAAMDAVESTGGERLSELVGLLNGYKRFIELDLVFDSPDDFLYRQAGQIKLGASIMEEFLPRLVDPRIVPELEGVNFVTGPRRAFSGAYFMSSLTQTSAGAGFAISKKDQDFTVGRAVWIKASTDSSFAAAQTVQHTTHIAYLAAECKTNLDKTMFMEAAATSQNLKAAVAGSRYFLICEWLDMTPVNSKTTAIDEVLILRGKRLQSNQRKGFARAAQRRDARDFYSDFLRSHPIRVEPLQRLVAHMRAQFAVQTADEESVLKRGYF